MRPASMINSLAFAATLGFASLVGSTSNALAENSSVATKAAAETKQSADRGDFIPRISSFMLENGMQVVVIPDRRAPVVTHMVWYKAGSADEPPGKSGIAHYLEHLMFKGTSNTPAGEFSEKVSEIGGQENAFTSVDYTAYFQKVTPETLEMVMGYEADRMENLTLTDETVLPERSVILEERRQRVGANPGAILGESLQAVLYKHHPYGTPIIGWEHEMLQLTKEDAIAFYDRFYTPNNAILVVAGDVDEATVRELAEKTYGKVERRAEPGERERVQEPVPVTERRVVYRDERVTRPSWQRIYLVPSYRLAEGNDGEALELLGAILGGSSTARINKQLVLEDEIATGAGAYYWGGAMDMTRFAFYGGPKGEATVEELEAAMDAVINDIVENGVNQEELDRARNSLLKTTIYDRDSQTRLARIVGAVLSAGGTIEEIQTWATRLDQVGVDDVNRVARKYLKRHRSVTGILLPETDETRS